MNKHNFKDPHVGLALSVLGIKDPTDNPEDQYMLRDFKLALIKDEIGRDPLSVATWVSGWWKNNTEPSPEDLFVCPNCGIKTYTTAPCDICGAKLIKVY